MTVEGLESRRLLNGSITAKLTHTGVLQVAGSSEADVLTMEIVSNRLRSSSTDLGIALGTKVKRIRIDLAGGNDKLTIKSDVGTFVDGKAGRDSITVDTKRATVLGGSGNDILRSIPSLFDRVHANQVLRNMIFAPGFQSTDFDVFAGSFNTLEGGPGDDVFYTRGGDDVTAGGSGFDRFIGLTDDITVFNSTTYPLGRSAVVSVWASNAMVVEIEQTELREAGRSVFAYF